MRIKFLTIIVIIGLLLPACSESPDGARMEKNIGSMPASAEMPASIQAFPPPPQSPQAPREIIADYEEKGSNEADYYVRDDRDFADEVSSMAEPEPELAGKDGRFSGDSMDPQSLVIEEYKIMASEGLASATVVGRVNQPAKPSPSITAGERMVNVGAKRQAKEMALQKSKQRLTQPAK